MRLFLIVFLLVSISSCNEDNNAITTTEKVEFYFEPSFAHPAKFTIDYSNKTLDIDVFEEYYVEQLEYSDTTKPYIVEHGDTLINYYNRAFKINERNFQKFVTAERRSGFTESVAHGRSVLDGIWFKISKLYSNHDTLLLRSRSPDNSATFKMDYKLLDALFDILYSTVNDSEGIAIVEDLQHYFDIAPIRITRKDPLEIRVHNYTFGGCRISKDYLKSYIYTIPNKPIIFDFRNGSLAHCLYWVFEEIGKEREIYFYGKNEVNKCFKDTRKLLEEYNSNSDNPDIRSKSWERYKKKKELMHSRWKENRNINWFSTREEVLKTIANKK